MSYGAIIIRAWGRLFEIIDVAAPGQNKDQVAAAAIKYIGQDVNRGVGVASFAGDDDVIAFSHDEHCTRWNWYPHRDARYSPFMSPHILDMSGMAPTWVLFRRIF